MSEPAARLQDGSVIVPEPLGGRLHNRHGLGEPTPAGLRLSLTEAAWCLLGGRIRVAGVASVAELLAQGGDEVEHLAYCDLRERGLTVRHKGGGLAVWPRGQGLEAPPAYTVHSFGERQAIPTHRLLELAGSVAALVDDDGAVTCYRIEKAELGGERPTVDLSRAAGRLLRDRVLVEDPASLDWHKTEGIGVRHGTGLVLSLVEAEHLRRRGVLDCPGVEAAASGPALGARLAVHDALRAQGVVAKSGFKFGTHVRGYRADPDEGHAEWLVQAAQPEDGIAWSDLSRAIRLAHGVRKRFLVAVAAQPVRFLDLSWFRP